MTSVRSLAALAGTACLALAITGSTGLNAASPGAAIDLVPHRAIYDLSLDSRSSSASISGIRGRMVHEFMGGPCDGYSISMRWVAQMADGDGGTSIDDVRFASFEEADGASYTYTSTRFLNDRKVEEVKAFAKTDEGGGSVSLTLPEEASIPLPKGTLFPTQHLMSVIDAARTGKVIAEDSVYDVSEDGKNVYNTLTVVGSERPEARNELSRIADQATDPDLESWRVTISYFKGGVAGEETPDFEQTFDLFSNGIASDLRLDYGEIVVKGTLKNVVYLGAHSCH